MKITTEDFIKKAKELHPDKNYDYSKVIYVKSNLKVEIICPIHGSFFQKPNDHNNSKYPQNCPNCSQSKKSNIKEFIIKAKKIHGDKYDYSYAEYENCHKPMRIFCKEHNSFFMQNSNNHLQGQNCPCGRNERIGRGNKKLNQESFIEKSKEIHGDRFNYSLIEFKDIKKPIKIICNKHNLIFEQSPDSHIRSKHCCPICLEEKGLNTNRTTKEEFIKKAKKIHGDLYCYDKVVYNGNDENIKIFCKRCNDYFYQKPRNHTSAKCGCPVCSSSSGELDIEKFLKEKNIKFERQKIFKECKLKKYLKFDFYVKDFNCVIEFNGLQHYEFVEFFHKTYSEFILRQKRDEIKRNYAKENNLKILEIPYWQQKDIYNILTKEFNLNV